MPSRRDISFYSDGLKIAGYLYTPDDWHEGDPPRPGILCLAGYSGMKDVYLLPTVERLAREGWFTVAIDHRGFGISEGKRGRHRPLEQAQDAFDALSFMQTVPEIDPDRIGIFGTSFGGANGIWVAALDERVKVLVTRVAVTNGDRWMRLIRRPWEWRAFKEMIESDARRRVVTGEPTMRPLPEIMLPDPHTAMVLREHLSKGANFVGEYDLESAEACLRYRPEWVVDKISPRPVMFIYSELDNLVPSEEQIACYAQSGEPKKRVRLPGAQHYEAYAFINPEKNEIGTREA
ncbi:MAG: alpha/beta fold hydrolase, partial [Chloroflexi bacterium]|nr:alpha/beta fold hydrolase [Chloroflexota bacterium]